MIYHRFLSIFMFAALFACDRNTESADAYGNFEAVEVIISAETQGRITDFPALEGTSFSKGQVVASIDSMQLYLKRKQLLSVLDALPAKIRTLEAQVRASEVQLANLRREKERIDNLFEGGAATPKQQDDINGQLALVKAQMQAIESQKASVFAERNTLQVQVEQVEDQILRCAIKAPRDGMMLTKYKEAGEIVAPGQPLFKMANLDNITLRAYVSGNQISEFTLGRTVTVSFDGPDGIQETPGQVTWISPQAEFTPKIIQTREERISLVYAIKITVPNTGQIKIGMPGEVNLP